MGARILLEVVPRITSLLVFHSMVETALRVNNSHLFSLFPLKDASQLCNALLLYASIVLAVATVISASPVLYSLTLVSNTLLNYGRGIQVSLISLTGLAVLLGFSSLKTGYRDGQGKSIKYLARWGFVKGLTWISVFITLLLIASLALSFYSFTFLQGLMELKNPLTSLLSLNPLVKLSLVLALIVMGYKVIDSLFESMILFIFPSRRFSLEALTSRRDVDVLFNPSLGFIRSIILGAIVSPFIYAGLDLLIIRVLQWANLFLAIGLIRAFLPYLVFFLASYGAGRALSSMHRMNPSSTLAAAIAIFTLLYFSGVFFTYSVSGSFWLSLVRPNFTGLIERIEMVFINYYISFFYLIDVIGSLMGFAP